MTPSFPLSLSRHYSHTSAATHKATMAATTVTAATSFSISISSSKTLKPSLSGNSGFRSSSSPLLKPLRAKSLSYNGCSSSGGALNVRMVSDPTAVKEPTISLDFLRSMCNPYGHEEGPAQAQNLRDSLTEAKSDIVVKGPAQAQNLRDSLTEAKFDIVVKGPAQAQNLRDSLTEAKSDIVVKCVDGRAIYDPFEWKVPVPLFEDKVNIFSMALKKGLLTVSNSWTKDAKREYALSASKYPCMDVLSDEGVAIVSSNIRSTGLMDCCFYEGHLLPMAKINSKRWTADVQVLSNLFEVSTHFGATPVGSLVPPYLLFALFVGVSFKLMMDSRWFCHFFCRHSNVPVRSCDAMVIESIKRNGDKPTTSLKEEVVKEVSCEIHVNITTNKMVVSKD